MQLPGYTCAFRQPFLKATLNFSCHAPEPEKIDACEKRGSNRQCEESKPVCFVVVPLLTDFVDYAGTIPHSVAVACANMERMGAQWDARVYRGAGCVGVQPDRIDAVQPVLETDLFRRPKLYRIALALQMVLPAPHY